MQGTARARPQTNPPDAEDTECPRDMRGMSLEPLRNVTKPFSCLKEGNPIGMPEGSVKDPGIRRSCSRAIIWRFTLCPPSASTTATRRATRCIFGSGDCLRAGLTASCVARDRRDSCARCRHRRQTARARRARQRPRWLLSTTTSTVSLSTLR